MRSNKPEQKGSSLSWNVLSKINYDENMEKILLFIPFYNCEAQITRVLKQVKTYEDRFSEILLVDNRSEDKSCEEAKATIEALKLPKVTIVRNKQNYNLGGSHKVGFRYALEKGHDYIVVLHGDDQGQLVDLMALVKKKEHHVFDCLLGARFHPGSRLVGYSKFRTLGNKVLNAFCSLTVGHRVKDMGSGLNMYKASFIKDERILGFRDDLTFNIFLLFHAYFNNRTIKYFPITWKEEDQVSNAKVFRQLRIIMGLVVKTLISRSSLYQNYGKQEYSYDVIYHS